MTGSKTDVDWLVEQISSIDGLMRDDIQIHEDKVTTYVPTKQMEAVRDLDDSAVEILEEHEYEYLISITPRNVST
jgi:hypothetical protein